MKGNRTDDKVRRSSVSIKRVWPPYVCRNTSFYCINMYGMTKSLVTWKVIYWEWIIKLTKTKLNGVVFPCLFSLLNHPQLERKLGKLWPILFLFIFYCTLLSKLGRGLESQGGTLSWSTFTLFTLSYQLKLNCAGSDILFKFVLFGMVPASMVDV